MRYFAGLYFDRQMNVFDKDKNLLEKDDKRFTISKAGYPMITLHNGWKNFFIKS